MRGVPLLCPDGRRAFFKNLRIGFGSENKPDGFAFMTKSSPTFYSESILLTVHKEKNYESQQSHY